MTRIPIVQEGKSQRQAAKELGVDPATMRQDLGLRETPSKREGKSLIKQVEAALEQARAPQRNPNNYPL